MPKYNSQDNDDYLLEHNLLGAKSFEELEQAEAFAFSLRAAALEKEKGMLQSFSEKEFKDLHYYLFKDIYPFAGQYRNVQLMKGNTRFCQAQFLNRYSLNLFQELSQEPPWKSEEQAVDRLAYYKSELNLLHPFREGNGRTIRIFLRAFAISKGFMWEFEKMDRDEYIQAMIQSVTNVQSLRDIFAKTIYKI
ncbi:Fic family protein [Gracilibacillus sp. YIM 98692]|uniref:Fic/DOC family protein n=1 Tax=Gracilibacillus sp. YIM 98692 TaxID=2663532 RepID=UPI0013D293A3|nr:Fic family protein [Gracilibacillus sp. YIM 98692]